MATNVLQPQGLIYSRQKGAAGGSPTLTQFTTKKALAPPSREAILSPSARAATRAMSSRATTCRRPSSVLFAGVQPYFDATAQQVLHGSPLNGAYPTAANPLADIPRWVTANIMVVFRTQVQGGPFAQSWFGNNRGRSAVPGRGWAEQRRTPERVVETASQYCAAAASPITRHCAQNRPRLSGRPRSGRRLGGGGR
jgi:hypothetical protein